MKVFMSWSGQRSKLTAELLHGWIKCVIQAAQPWISSKGIERGAMWFSEINNELKDTTIGIVCLTQENKNAPWILFEAGALTKGLASNRVCTFLVDLEPADLQPPLGQFNHTFPTRESMWSLVNTLNNGLETNRLDVVVLQRVFDTYWPQFEAEFKQILADAPPVTVVTPREEKDILSEILETTRHMSQRIRLLENQGSHKSHVFVKPEYAHLVNWKKSQWIDNENSVKFDFSKFDWRNLAHVLMYGGKSSDEVRSLLLNAGLCDKQVDEIMRHVASLPPSGESASS
ncbi:hypothetical protein [Massilia sp. CFBP9026]|uniref:hypothetical protein n=1 Tax=Massilia sp. CFBP9026 TaxID=3096536 RepID=UPI002A6B525E|nr:hypothetical protein [Massilia sp. CFBP9026]MDY0965092.1 hypothetical protein [Massilia sp. CFBP9026]